MKLNKIGNALIKPYTGMLSADRTFMHVTLSGKVLSHIVYLSHDTWRIQVRMQDNANGWRVKNIPWHEHKNWFFKEKRGLYEETIPRNYLN